MGGDAPKQFLELAGQPILYHCLERLLEWVRSLPAETRVQLVVTHPADAADEMAALLRRALAGQDDVCDRISANTVAGGATRQDSVRAGLEALDPSVEAVFIHDGVRPLASAALYARLLDAWRQTGKPAGILPLLPPADSLKQLDGSGRVLSTVDRDQVRAVQTPQLMAFPLILELHRRAAREGFSGTDDASLVEHFAAGELLAIDGERSNIKLTRRDDLLLAAALLGEQAKADAMNHDTPSMPGLRIGQGFDVHAFAPDRPLVLGGVTIPFERGLAGHSDADVLLHSIADALLGAAALGDIGRHFPDTDPRWKDADSWKLLQAVGLLVRQAGYTVLNLDATLICQRPKIQPHAASMVERICAALELAPSQVGLKATTTEQLGFTGREEGIAAQAVVLLSRHSRG